VVSGNKKNFISGANSFTSSISKDNWHGERCFAVYLQRTKKTRGHWILALSMILRDDKAKPGMKFREAVDAWLEWGGKNGYI